jgi:hypothetical protein
VVTQGQSGPGWRTNQWGQLIVTEPGTVLSNLDIPLSVEVQAANVVIRDCRIHPTGDTWGVGLRHTSNVTISDSEIFSPSTGGDRLEVGVKDVNGDARNTSVLRVEIWHTSTGVQIHSGVIADSYIHSMGYASGDHLNGITSNGGTTAALRISHNTVFNDYGQTDAISLFEDFGPQTNRVIDNNLVAGGGYTIYAGQNAGGPAATNIQVTNNRFARLYFPTGGSYGPYTAYRSGNGNAWSGNVWDDNGAAIE